MVTAKQKTTVQAYEFLTTRAKSQKAFTLAELAAASGWKEVSAKTYLSKKLKQLVSRRPDGKYIAKLEILQLSCDRFLGHMTQRKPIFTEYKRHKHEHLLTYEFLIPLTREDKLRKALDDLFFSDTIRSRLQEIGIKALETLIARESGTSEDAYLDYIVTKFAGRVSGGYSIGHARGRFRASQDLRSRQQAGEMLANNERYLVDETAAVVRFLIPLEEAKAPLPGDFESTVTALENVEPTDSAVLATELRIARALFFHLFVEAVVRIIEGEDEIWLIEEAPQSRRLYRWSRRQ